MYELRKINRTGNYSWIDNDKSGDFDPKEEMRQKIQRPTKAKASKATQKQKKAQNQPHRTRVPRKVVKFRFKAFGSVRDVTNDEDSRPEGYVSDSDDESAQETRAQKQTRGNHFCRQNTPGFIAQETIIDPLGELDDLTGHSAARGCIACRQKEQPCSMVKDGTYPCNECSAETEVCQPIIPHNVIGSCKRCIETGTTCSFEDSPEQLICDQCTNSECLCEPLPFYGSKAGRVDIYEVMRGAKQSHTQCTNCRALGKRCSLKTKQDEPPCKYCKRKRFGCTFFDVKKPAGNGSKKRKLPTEGDAPKVAVPGADYFTAQDLQDMMGNSEDDISSREATPEMDMEDIEGRRGVLTKVKTSFSHPITFDIANHGTRDCFFCEMPMFPMVGFTEREVHVIRWNNGAGLSEVGGGHSEHNGPTKLCTDCTLSRLQIMVCESHQVQRTHDHRNQEPFQQQIEYLMLAAGTSEYREALQRWCSFCFSVATFACYCRQTSLSTDTELAGCGLKLCDRCELALRDEYVGNLSYMAFEMDKMPKISDVDDQEEYWEGRIRADVGLLSDDGFLNRTLNAEEEGK